MNRFEGGLTAATQAYSDRQSPDLLIVETREAAAQIFTELDQLAGVCRPDTNLILLGPHNDVLLYRQLAKRGVSEYIPTPASPAHVVDAVLGAAVDPDEPRQGRLISFIGASGGCGSTSLANNTAWQLGKVYDNEVILADLDLAFGTVGLDYNLESAQSSAQALAQADRIDDQMLARFLVRYDDNLSLLTSPGDGNAGSDIEPAALEKLLRTLRRNAAWVVVDLPHYWGGWVRQVLDTSDEIVVTAVPTLASLRNAKSMVDTLNAVRKNDNPVRVVLNHVGWNPKTDIPSKDFVSTLGCSPAAQIPHDPTIFAHAANAGRMIGENKKGQRILDQIRGFATLVGGRPAPEKRAASRRLDPLQWVLSWSR